MIELSALVVSALRFALGIAAADRIGASAKVTRIRLNLRHIVVFLLNVRSGSKAALMALKSNFRFSPNQTQIGHRRRSVSCQHRKSR
jgi:hypothetical protein